VADLVYQPGNSALSANILVSAAQLVPNTDGSYRAPYPKVAGSIDEKGYTATSAYSAFMAINASGGKRLFLGMGVSTSATYTSEIYACNEGATTWSTVESASSVIASSLIDYSGWHFCQYENQTIACCLTFATQTATTGNCSDLAGAPRAKVVDTLNDALWLWNVHSGGTHYPDELWISDVGDITDYTPVTDGSSLAFKTQLTDCPGPGTAEIRFRDFMVIFKARGMWLGQYTGDDRIYDVSLYSANVGCIGKDACIVAENTLYFADDQNVYAFDGANLRSIADDSFITKTLTQSILNPESGTGQSASRTQLHYDDVNKILTIYARDGARPQPAFTYNVVSGKWGKIDAGSTYVDSLLCVLNAPADDLIDFENLGVTASSNENRVNFAGYDIFPKGRFMNGHNSDTSGSAVTAYFGSAFQASTLRQVFMNADSNTGVTVADQTKRAPRSSATTQGSASAAAFSADMLADFMCDGNFHKLTWAWNAQTHASPADFRKWQGFEMDQVRSGKR
jgi:hypothetical protein